MGLKPNQRIALTKELIYRAFLKLLKEKNIHQISIRELCDNAGINRTTFYNHYGSQYDVLLEMEGNYLNEISRSLEIADAKNRESVQSQVTLVLEYMFNNLELSKLLIKNNIEDSFAMRLFSLPKIEDMLSFALSDIADTELKQDIVTFAVYGSYRLLQEWIEDAERKSPQEEAKLILGLARRVCSQ